VGRKGTNAAPKPHGFAACIQTIPKSSKIAVFYKKDQRNLFKDSSLSPASTHHMFETIGKSKRQPFLTCWKSVMLFVVGRPSTVALEKVKRTVAQGHPQPEPRGNSNVHNLPGSFEKKAEQRLRICSPMPFFA